MVNPDGGCTLAVAMNYGLNFSRHDPVGEKITGQAPYTGFSAVLFFDRGWHSNLSLT